MASLTLQDGRTISFPDGLQPDQVKKIVAAAQASTPWSDVPRQAMRNLPASALQFGKNLIHPILHPLETYESLGKVTKGVGDMSREAMFPGLSRLTGKEADPQATEAAGNVGQALKERYGGVENLKRTLATDPVGASGDLAAVFAGGGGAAARLAGLGKIRIPPLPRPAGQTRASMALLRNAAPKDARAFADLGDEAMLLDASPSMTGLAQGVAPLPGKARNSIVEELFARQQGRSKRLVADTTSTLGKARDPTLLKELLNKLHQRRSGLIYEKAFKDAPALPGTLDDILATQLTSPTETLALSSRKTGLGIFDEIDDAMKAETPEIAARRLMSIRQNLDAQIVHDRDAFNALSSADKAGQGPLKQARAAIDDILKNRVPGIREGDAIVAESKGRQRSVDYGFNALEGGKYAISPERMTRDLGKLDKRFVGEGMKADIRTAMGTQANDLAALRKKVGGDLDFNREKIAQVFGQNKPDRLVKSIDREERFGQSYADIARNSQTAQRLEGSRAVSAPDAPRFSGQETVLGLTAKGTAKLLNAVVAKTIGRAHKPTADALTRALIAKGPEARQLLNALMTGDARSRVKILTALLAEQSAVGALEHSHR